MFISRSIRLSPQYIHPSVCQSAILVKLVLKSNIQTRAWKYVNATLSSDAMARNADRLMEERTYGWVVNDMLSFIKSEQQHLRDSACQTNRSAYNLYHQKAETKLCLHISNSFMNAFRNKTPYLKSVYKNENKRGSL